MSGRSSRSRLELIFSPPLLAAFWLIEPSFLEPLLRAVMHRPLSFKAAHGDCRARSHASPVIVFGLNGIPCKSVENGSIVLEHIECPFISKVAIKGWRDKRAKAGAEVDGPL